MLDLDLPRLQHDSAESRRSPARPRDVDVWTVDDAAVLLHPLLSAVEVRSMIDLFGIPSHGARRTGRRGRPAPTYDATRLQEAHAVVMRARIDLGRFEAAS